MEKRFLLLCISTLLLLSIVGCKSSTTAPSGKVKRYPYERFHIHYEISGGARGVEDAYIADYGKYEGRYMDVEMLRSIGNERLHTVTINRGADRYMVEIEHNDGEHSFSLKIDSLYRGLIEPLTPQELTEVSLRAMRISKVGTDTVIGKVCDGWSSIDDKLNLWISDGMLLRKRTPDMEGGWITQTATLIDTNWVVDSTKFVVPQGIPIREKKDGE